MTPSDPSDDRDLFDVDHDKRIATITFNNPKQRNSYDAAMREAGRPLSGSRGRRRRPHRGAVARSRRSLFH